MLIVKQDGRGVRGFASLVILKELMLAISKGGTEIKPCDYFDIIAGTGMGG